MRSYLGTGREASLTKHEDIRFQLSHVGPIIDFNVLYQLTPHQSTTPVNTSSTSSTPNIQYCMQQKLNLFICLPVVSANTKVANETFILPFTFKNTGMNNLGLCSHYLDKKVTTSFVNHINSNEICFC